VGEQQRGFYCYRDVLSKDFQVIRIITYDMWHQRLGHPSNQAMSFLFSNVNSSFCSSDREELCDVCQRARKAHMLFHTSENKVIECFNLLHYYIWRAYCASSFHGAHYFLSIVDYASRATWVFLMKEKGKASQLIKDFCIMVKTQFGVSVVAIRSDSGKEFTSGPMTKFYAENDMLYQTSCVDTPSRMEELKERIDILDVDKALCF